MVFGFSETGKYLLKRLPIGNLLLQTLMVLDPNLHLNESALAALKKLPKLLKLDDDIDMDDYSREVITFTSTSFPEYSPGDRLDCWYHKYIFSGGNFPNFSHVVKAA